MRLRVELDWRDYLEAVLLNMRPTPAGRIVLIVVAFFLACGFVIGVVSLAQGIIMYEIIAPAIVLGGVYVLWRHVLLPKRIRHLFSQQKRLATPTEVELTGSALKTSDEYGSSELPWPHFVKWRENNRLFALYQSDVLLNILPKRAFTDLNQIDYLRDRLTKYVPASKSRRMALTPILILILVLIIMALVFQFRSSAP